MEKLPFVDVAVRENAPVRCNGADERQVTCSIADHAPSATGDSSAASGRTPPSRMQESSAFVDAKEIHQERRCVVVPAGERDDA